ncbi:restriction endonuclease subunit S [Actinoallomurus bryophytorum]|uniref:Type I restriction enzyme S subunit n=1 Tax=Actinoallomurus bryophytorum TaxID=1490222 RepID=A0A543CIN4_9ACTN|nr:restriction endonuclease subunit S [Actinoallomurus bryophytorum]TQL96964.1 type I restriction enzyme S subunit [Actinoallomurus bryophytorum]
MTGPLWTRLPDGWLTGQVRNVATVTLGKMLQSKDSGSDMPTPYMRAANVQPNGVLALDDVNEMWFSEAELEQLSIRAGDVVVVEGGQGGFGRAAYVENDLPGWGFQNSINRLRPIGDFDGRFIAFYLIALRASGYIRAYCNVVSMPHLTAEKLARIPIPLPPVKQQRAIADYLDRETARIDTLIEEQQTLVRLLAERRVAVMADPFGQAHPTAPLGAVLEELIDHRGKTPGKVGDKTDDFTDEGVPVVSAIHIKNGQISWDERERFVPYWMFEKWMPVRLRTGDVLLTSEAPLGNVAQVPTDAPLVLSQRLFALRSREDILDSTYLRFFLESDRGQALLRDGASGSTVSGIRQSRLVQVPVPVPPVDEQRRVSQRIREQITKIDTLMAETARFVELSKERRAALITAAVTGQIDV